MSENGTVDWKDFLDFDVTKDGCCDLAAEQIAIELLERNCEFKVIEGYVWTKSGISGEISDAFTWPTKHTWIEMENGEIIDPTVAQFEKYGGITERILGIAYTVDGDEYGESETYEPEEYLIKSESDKRLNLLGQISREAIRTGQPRREDLIDKCFSSDGQKEFRGKSIESIVLSWGINFHDLWKECEDGWSGMVRDAIEKS